MYNQTKNGKTRGKWMCLALVHYGPATEQSTQRNRTRTSRYQQPIRRSKPQAANQPATGQPGSEGNTGSWVDDLEAQTKKRT